jgi:hypothetical protein
MRDTSRRCLMRQPGFHNGIAIVIIRIACLEFKILETRDRLIKRNRLLTIAITFTNPGGQHV